MLQPIRLSILERLNEPGSASSLAPSLKIPRQQVNYHLRELEKARLVEFVEERRKGNCIERIYRSCAQSYVIGPSALMGASPDTARIADQASADYQVAVAAQLIQDLTDLRSALGQIPTLTLETEVAFASDAARGDFAMDLANAIASLAKKYHTEGGEPFRLIVAAHQAEAARRK
jgi:DNA-binding transcriptional ArsR family regulator